MATEVVMPRLSDTMDEGTIAKWLKHEGDEVKRGDIIAEIETDKSNMELESYANGILAQIIVQEGQTAALGQPIAMIAADQDEARQLKSGGKEAAQQQRSAAPESRPEPRAAAPSHNGQGAAEQEAPAAAPVAVAREPGERVKASPLARRLAQEHGLELATIPGTGPGGRITKDDVQAYLRQAPAAQPATQEAPAEQPAAQPAPVSAEQGGRASQPIQMTRMQQTIARRMAESKFSAPEFLLTAEYDLTEARALLKNIGAVEGAPKVGPNDLVIKAAATALRQHPEVNSGWENGGIVRFGRINVGNAVAVEGGLVVPVIHDADQKSLGQIAVESKALIDKARAGKLQPNEYEGGTFTVSNLGMYGIDQFTAIINPPEACILAVGAIVTKPVVVDGEVVVRDRMRVTLTVDHRLINGAQGADFLRTLRQLLENPMLVLL
jgi:pyruvate dehydrogenase E2 component (dihydrolipoamide acetyltransferase)